MRNGIVIFFVSFLIFQGCNQQTEENNIMNQQEINAIKKAVENRVLQYVTDLKALNIDKMLSFWADSDEFVTAPDGKMVVGYKDFANGQRQKFSEVSSVAYVNIHNTHVYVLAKDAASFTFEFGWEMGKKSGEKIISKGTWTYVFKLFGDDWKVVTSTGTHI